MGMSIEDMYDWLYRLKSELVVYMPKEWHEPMRCSIQDAITFSRKYQMLKADYENRLKADLAAILEKLSMKIGEIEDGYTEFDEENKRSLTMIPLESVERLIDKEINSLKEA